MIKQTKFFCKNKNYPDGLDIRCRQCAQKSRKQFRIENLEKIKTEHRKWYLENKDEIRKDHRRYSKTADCIFSTTRSKAKRRNIVFNISKTEFIRWYNEQDRICLYCKRPEAKTLKDMGSRANRLTIDRKNNDKGYELNNIVLACYRCNTEKGNFWTYEEMLLKGKISEKLYNERIK